MWLGKFNPKITKFIPFGHNEICQTPDLVYDRDQLERVNSYKQLVDNTNGPTM